MTRRRLAFACLLIVPALAACGGGSKSSASSGGEATSTPTPTPTATATPAATKPKVKVPSGKPPKRLVARDLRVGTGLPARAGQTVSVQYVGVNYKNGKQFDASWDRGQPFNFTLGAGQVIPGWDKGVVGMQPGRAPRADHPALARLRVAGPTAGDQAERDARLRHRPDLGPVAG